MSNVQSVNGIAKRKRAYKIVTQALLILALTFIAVVIIYPLIFVLSTSFKTYGEFLKSPFSLSLKHPENYLNAFKVGRFGTAFLNSLIIAVVSTVCTTFTTTLAVFAIGVLRFRGSSLIVGALMFTMFISGDMTTVPAVLLIRALGLYNSLGSLIFQAALGVSGIGVFIGINYVRGIPEELHEAASLDGASIPQMFFRVDLPMLKPIMAYVAIGCFGGAWGDFFGPLIFIPMNDNALTLAVAVQRFDTQNNSQYGTLCAGLMILAAPSVLIYSCFSKYFLEGIAVGAVKG